MKQCPRPGAKDSPLGETEQSLMDEEGRGQRRTDKTPPDVLQSAEIS